MAHDDTWNGPRGTQGDSDEATYRAAEAGIIADTRLRPAPSSSEGCRYNLDALQPIAEDLKDTFAQGIIRDLVSHPEDEDLYAKSRTFRVLVKWAFSRLLQTPERVLQTPERLAQLALHTPERPVAFTQLRLGPGREQNGPKKTYIGDKCVWPYAASHPVHD